MPFVAAMRTVGMSTIARDSTYDRRGERRMQTVLASFLMAALAVLFYATARLLLPVGWSLVGALVGALGTQVWSTAALALWSDTCGILLLGGVVWIRHAKAIRYCRLLAVLGLRAMLDSGPPSRPVLAAGAVLAVLSIVIQYRGA